MKQTAESKTAQAILETPQEIHVGTRVYRVAPPTMATLILASEIVSTLPSTKLEFKRLIYDVLSIARHCKPIGNLVALLILGEEKVSKRKPFWKRESEMQELSRYILRQSPMAVSELANSLLEMKETDYFFGLTTSLTEINLIRPTKEVGKTKTTASGQS